MLENYIPILIIFIVASIVPVAALGLSALLGPRKPTPRKLIPYESGMVPVGSAQRRLPIRFYLVAMLFILFDIEVIFLLPYALVYRKLALFGLVEMGVFVLILLIGYIYIVKKGALRWD